MHPLHQLAALLIVFLLLCNFSLSAQQEVIVYHDFAQFQDSTDIQFYFYRYESEIVDLTDFKKKYPLWEGPDSIKIVPPKKMGFRDTVLMMGLLRPDAVSEDELILWITGNYNSNKVTFFIDRTLDRNFRNDGSPIVIEGGKQRSIEITPQGNRNKIRDILLDVQFKEQFVIRRFKRKVNNALSVGVFFGMSVGGLHYQYDDTNIGYPTWYDVHITGRNFGINLSYEFNRFRIGAQFVYQNFFYWTSSLNIRRGEPYSVFVPTTGEHIDFENVLNITNRDIHSKHRFEWGLNLAMRLYASRWLEIQPTLTAGIITYGSEKYIANRFNEAEVYQHDPDPFVEGGALVEATVGNRKAIFAGVTFNKSWWNPEPFFESLDQENLEIRYNTWRVIIGYKLALW